MKSEQLFELRRRTFDTPEFRGIELIEAEAKTIINRVPGKFLPFAWTINPYRGCTHACSYCMSGETPTLMADGSTKPIRDLSAGDEIYGTERRDTYRHYVKTRVLAHWRTVKPAYRVTLEDGTQLIASGDHRFLSDRGWKHVTGSEQGRARRPHLTVNNKLMGTGRFASPERPIDGRVVNAAVRVVAVEPLGIDLPMYDITTGTGDFIADGVVSHNCFARVTHTYMDMDAGRDFETKIVVKVNAPDVLRRQLASRRWKGEHIAMGTGTDPYQRAEGRYALMRGIINALIDYRNPFSILTKGTLILRDLDLLKEAAAVTDVSTSLSIGTLDEDAWRRSEPGTPHPKARLEAVRALNDAGIPCGVLVAPVLPGITDGRDKLGAVVRAAVAAGATHVSPIMLHLRPVVREEYLRWLAREYPHLLAATEARYASGAYGPVADRRALSRTVGEIVRASGGTRRATSRRRWRRGEPSAERTSEPQQLKLL